MSSSLLLRAALSLTLPLFSFALLSCGKPTVADSKTTAVVGRGGSFFDRRVQVIHALPNEQNQTTCLYLSEFKKGEDAVFSGHAPLTDEQKDFLARAEREAKPLTSYPVSIDALDRGLAQKENLRRLRGALLIPMGIGSSFVGFGIIAAAMSPLCPGCFWGGMTLGQVLSNPLTYPFWGMGLGGLGLLSQASRDLNGKNYGVRSDDAALGASQAPPSTNLGVTLAFANVAQGLPPASKDACPANLTADALRPYFSSAFEFQASLSEAERERKSEAALEKLKSSKGCFFAAEDSGEKWIYQAHPLENGARTLRLQSYRVRPNVDAQLVADEDLVLQLSSDAGLGRKYVVENERGSIAIWLSSVEEGAGVRAHLAHRFPSGSYAGGRAQVSGRCVF